METKVLQVFYGKDCLPYKDKERSVHFPIIGAAIQGASNTTKIRFYFDELVSGDDETTSWVVVSKLPNGKIGSEIVETALDEELNEHYALFTLKNFYTQAKGDLFLSLQGYQGGVQVETDPDTGISQIIGTPTIQATGSIKLAINYATQLVGSGETANINFQKILADLGTKLGIRAYTERVSVLPTTGQTNVFYAIYDDHNNPNKLNIYVWNATIQSYVWVGDNTLYLGDYYTKDEGENLENRMNDLESQITSIASGTPKGAFSTVAALESADPSHDYIYVVSENNHWYYWNSANEEWADGGVYVADVLSGQTFDLLDKEYEVIQHGKIELTPTLVDGYCNVNTGVLYNNSYGNIYLRTNYIPIILSSKLASIVHNFDAGGDGGVCFYDEDKVFISSTTSKNITSIPSNAKYIVLTDYNVGATHETKNIAFNYSGENFDKVKELIEDNQNDIIDLSNELIEIMENGNLSFVPDLVDGYINKNTGAVNDIGYSVYKRTGLIKIPSQDYIISIVHNLVSADNAGIAFYDEDKVFISGTDSQNITNIPNNAIYVAFTDYNAGGVHTNKSISFNYNIKSFEIIQEDIIEKSIEISNNTFEIVQHGAYQISLELVEGFVNYSTGALSNNSYGGLYKRTNYINLSLVKDYLDKLSTNCVFDGSAGLAFYDEDKVFISGSLSTEIEEIPSNAKYIALSDFNAGGVHTNKKLSLLFNSTNFDNLGSLLSNLLQTKINGGVHLEPTLVDGYVTKSNGNISDNSYGGLYNRTGYIEIPGGTSSIVHNFVSQDAGGWAFYDNLKVFISGGDATTIVDIPSNAKYIAFTDYNAQSTHTDKYVNMNQIGICSSDISSLKFVSYGDSIVYQDKWQPYLVGKYGFEHTKLGIGSSPVAYHAETESEYPCMVNATRIAGVESANPDIIVIMGGTNDAHYGISIGTDAEFSKALASKDLTTFKGAYSYLIETLLTWKPKLTIILMTPMSSKWHASFNYPAYAQAVRDVAHYYSLPIADTNRESGISAFDYDTYTSDGLHPNDEGGKRLANIVAQKLNMIYYIK